MKLKLIIFMSIAMLLIKLGSSIALSQTTTPFDGLYYPPENISSCNPNIFSDRYPLRIENGFIEVNENGCHLTYPNKLNESGIEYIGACNAEGTDYIERITIIQTANGIEVTWGGKYKGLVCLPN